MKYLRHNQQILIHTLHRIDRRAASQVFQGKINSCTQDVHKVYSKRLTVKNNLKYSLQISLAKHASGLGLNLYLHQHYLLQGLMSEA